MAASRHQDSDSEEVSRSKMYKTDDIDGGRRRGRSPEAGPRGYTREECRRDRDPDGKWSDRRPRNGHVSRLHDKDHILERLPEASSKSKRDSDSEDRTMDRRKNDNISEHSSGSPHKQRNNDHTREEGRRDRDLDGMWRDRRPRNGHVILERLPKASGKSKRESDSEDGTLDRRKNDRLSEHSSGSPHKQRNNDHTRKEGRRDRDPDGKRRDRRPRNGHVSRLHDKDHILERLPEASGKSKRESDSEDGTMDRRKNDRLSENSSGSPHKQRNNDRHSSGEDLESDMGRKDKKHLKKYDGRRSERSHSHRDRNHHRSYKDSYLGDKYEERVKDDRNLYTKERSESPKPWLDRAGNMKGEEEEKKQQPPVQQMADAVTIKTGGIYIPPHRMAQMMRDVQDKSSEAYQRLSWDALKKSINGLVNKVNATNIKNIIPELFSENLIRGRGLFCRSCIKSQTASPGFTNIFAALVAVVNTKFPDVGKLLLKRVMLQFKRSFARNDKPQLLAAMKFIAHLVNQQVAHEVIALELLTVLLLNPTDDSVEVAVGFVKECGALLQDLVPLGLYGVFERFRGILHEGEIDKRVQFLIEALFAIRKAKFQGFPAIRAELDLVEQEDQFTHEMSFEDVIDPEFNLDVFKLNPQFLEDEKAYENLKKNILGDESSENEAGSDEGSDDEDEEKSEEEDEEQMKIKDETETNLVNLRRTIYLTIMSSVDFEEAGHKLLKIKLEPGQEMELCIMLLECCSQERTYLRYYGLLGQRFCMINKVHQENFEKCFVHQYSMIHRLETNKLRNVAKFFAHLLGTDALPWHVLSYIRLTEEDTTSSSRIFIKILFQELSEHLGIRLLNERLNDPNMQDSFDSIFPKDNPKNTRFAINFFTSIGLGGITENLRNYLKNMPRLIMQQQKPVSDSSGSVSDSSSSSSSSGSESESESESSSDDSRSRGKRQRRR